MAQALRRMEDLTNQQRVDPTHSVAASDMLVEEEGQAGSQLSPISNSKEEDHDSEEVDEVEETIHSTTVQTKVSVACQ